MKIKFTGKDPRAGMVARMDSSRGQQLIDAGCAVQVKENEVATSGFAPSNEGGKAETQQPKTRDELDRALASLPGENDDPEYVVGALRSYFGDLFTDDDEKRARAAFVDPKADNLAPPEPLAEQSAKGSKKGKGA